MAVYISTGNEKRDSMLRALVNRFDCASTLEVAVCLPNDTEARNYDCIIVLYDDEKYLSENFHIELLASHGEKYRAAALPFSIYEMSEIFHKFCRTTLGVGRSADSAKYDPATLTVSCGEESAELTKKEGALYELLLRHRGTPVSREAMRNEIWSEDNDTNCTDVYVNHLRRKLDKVLGDDSIVSVRGVGYMLKLR